MIGEYVRVTPDVMARGIDDPDWIRDYIDELAEAADFAEFGGEPEEDDEGPPPSQQLQDEGRLRLFTTYKAWNVLAYLLERADCPVDVIYGEESFTEDDDDWGYGPPRYLPPDRVHLAARVLAGYDYSTLAAGVTDEELHDAKVYPVPEPSSAFDEVSWAREWFDPMVAFFIAAAADGDAVICWLD
jgi:hypothetical protein